MFTKKIFIIKKFVIYSNLFRRSIINNIKKEQLNNNALKCYNEEIMPNIDLLQKIVIPRPHKINLI